MLEVRVLYGAPFFKVLLCPCGGTVDAVVSKATTKVYRFKSYQRHHTLMAELEYAYDSGSYTAMCESSSLSECTICRNSLVVELLITNQTTRVRFSLAAPYNSLIIFGTVAHWSCSGLKIHRRRFDSSLSHHRHIAQSG